MDSATKIPALSPESLSSPVFLSGYPRSWRDGYPTARGPGNMRVDVGKLISGTLVVPAHHSKLRAYFLYRQGDHRSRMMIESTMSASLRLVLVSPSEATSEVATRQRQDLTIRKIATDSTERGVKFRLLTQFSNSKA
jgi:hypothetical protein